jgi:hypothetical protein
MNDVLQKCFGGDWQAMLRFARRYDPAAREPSDWLGKQFREIIGTRNRSQFWNSVTKCEGPDSSGKIVDADSLIGLLNAIKRCEQGETFLIRVNAKIVGKLIPFKPGDH